MLCAVYDDKKGEYVFEGDEQECRAWVSIHEYPEDKDRYSIEKAEDDKGFQAF